MEYDLHGEDELISQDLAYMLRNLAYEMTEEQIKRLRKVLDEMELFHLAKKNSWRRLRIVSIREMKLQVSILLKGDNIDRDRS